MHEEEFIKLHSLKIVMQVFSCYLTKASNKKYMSNTKNITHHITIAVYTLLSGYHAGYNSQRSQIGWLYM